MQAFNRLGSTFSRVSGWASSVGGAIGEVPFIGGYLSTLFYRAGDYFGTLSGASYEASSWADSVQRSITDLPQTIDRAISRVSSALNATVDRLKNDLSTLRSALQANIDRAVSSTLNTVNRLHDSLKAAMDSAVSALQRDLSAVRSRVSNVGTGLASDVWRWMTSNVLQGYLDTWKGSLQSVVIAWVVAATGTLMTEAFRLLSSQWASFRDRFVWLTEKLITLMTDEARRFAPVLWSLIEAVIAELSQWRKK